jgi:hypothetical protein
MISDLLDAECAIKRLCALKIIKNTDWKGKNYFDDVSTDYSVYFDNPNHEGDVRLQIVKRARQYFVPCSIVKILAKRHHFDANSILEECSIKAA